MKFLFSLLISIFLIGCTSTKSNIKTIKYEAGACFGFCPMFKMTINEDRTALFEAERFNFSKDTDSQKPEGTFTGTIKKEDYDKLIKLINDANLKGMKSFYGDRNVTDLPTSHITINYKDGSTKHIEDYGKEGNPQLKEIHKFIEDLRLNQVWTKVEKP